MELKDLQAKLDPIDVPLVLDKDGNPTDGFKVLGIHSDEYRDVARALAIRDYVRSANRDGPPIDAKTKEGAGEMLDQQIEREFEIARACIVKIYGFTSDGNPAPLDEQTLRTIFTARPTWQAKVNAVIMSEARFTNA